MVLHSKQKLFSNDIKNKCRSYVNAAIPRISFSLGRYQICCGEKYLRCLVKAGVSPARDGRFVIWSVHGNMKFLSFHKNEACSCGRRIRAKSDEGR